MAIAAVSVYNSATTNIFFVTALDADTAAVNFAHNIAAGTPKQVAIAPLLAISNWGGWAVTCDATNVVISKSNVVGSGGTTPGTTNVLRVTVSLPHSIV